MTMQARLPAAHNALLLTIGLIAATLYVVPPPASVPGPMMQVAAVVFLTMALLATGLLSEYVTALLFFLVATLLAVAPPAVVFSGFASSTLWLVFGGLIIAEAVN